MVLQDLPHMHATVMSSLAKHILKKCKLPPCVRISFKNIAWWKEKEQDLQEKGHFMCKIRARFLDLCVCALCGLYHTN